jgi:hypothetical protein
MEKGGSMRKKSKLTQIDFCVKDLLTPASLRSDREWPISIGTSGRFGAEQLAEFSGINTIAAF